ncbi:MAG: Lar family restriction alleviation protein [Chloracidobacterium sp.]|nr:Lar family restriction alleviation protein [Chloracidobacterium sp.]
MTPNQANTRPELLPCPFCGGKAEFVPHPNWKPPWGWIRCIKCGSRSDDVKERDAHEYWNRRFTKPSYAHE